MSTNIQKEFEVSLFESVFNKEKKCDVSIFEILQEIKLAKYKKIVDEIRNTENKETRNFLKNKLPAITTSCTVEKERKRQDIKMHSGLIQIDFDEIEKSQSINLKHLLIADKYTFACFFSPSYKVKILVKIPPDINKHRDYFFALENYYRKTHSQQIDKSCKDVNRLMYLSYDSEIFVNADSCIYSDILIPQQKINNNKRGEREDAIKIINEIEARGIDITLNHTYWISIIYSLIEIFGSECRDYVHRVSRFYPNYSCEETNQKIDACLKSSGTGISKNTFFYYASNAGINITASGKNITKKEDNKKSDNTISSSIFDITEKYLSKYYDLRYNSVSLDFEIKKKSDDEYIPLNESSLFIELHKNNIRISMNSLLTLLKSDFVTVFDPLRDYFKSIPKWDGFDYIEDFANYIKAKDQEQFNYHLKKWFVRVVATAMNPDFVNKQAFVLISSSQDCGKSTWCRFLCPAKLKNYIAENISDDKDSRILLAKTIIINLDELATLDRKDINSLKSIFSKDKINERLPYDRRNTVLTRRCSFVGSTNQFEFLTDETGSVRWLCFELEKIDWDYKTKVNIDMVYSQALHLYNDPSFEYKLSIEDIRFNEKRNKDFQILSVERELLQSFFFKSLEKDEKYFKTATSIMIRINELTNNSIKIKAVQLGKALKILEYERLKHKGIWGYYVREKDSNMKSSYPSYLLKEKVNINN